MTTLEDRIRAATHAAADLVADGSAPPLDLARVRSQARWSRWPGRHGRLRKPLIPLAAAAAVLLIAVAAIAVPRSPDSGSQRHHPATGGPAAVLPRYLVTVHTDPWRLDVRNAVTGTLTAGIKVPVGYNWNAVAAQGPRTFIASKNQVLMGPETSYFYRLVIGSHGAVTSISRVGRGVHGTVWAASVTPDGRYVGYLFSTTYGPDGSHASTQVVLANLSTGKVIASWPVPDNDDVASLSIDAGGNALAISTYYYHYTGLSADAAVKHDLTQWTSVLRPATSGTPVDKLPELLPQAGTLALSPDGRTLYEFLQAGSVARSPYQDRNPVTFDLAAVNAHTGAVVSVLHTWRAVWADFVPQLALGPAGAYLLIADGASLARVSTATGQYTALPGSVPEIPALENAAGKLPPDQGGDIDPLAW